MNAADPKGDRASGTERREADHRSVDSLRRRSMRRLWWSSARVALQRASPVDRRPPEQANPGKRA